MRGPQKCLESTTRLVIGDDVSDIIGEFGHNLGIPLACRMAHSSDAVRHLSEPAFNSTEGTGKDSIQDQGGDEITDESKTSRRVDSSLSTAPPSFFPNPSL